MSWQGNSANKPNIQVEKTPMKEESYIQVPSSSPINVKSSPSKSHEALLPPDRNRLNKVLNDNKQLELEKKRQAIRQHKDFKVVRKSFYYLDESDIFKGFVKGKGNLRDITRWLSDNFNKQEILDRLEKEKQRVRNEEQQMKSKLDKERLERAYQQQQELIKVENEKKAEQVEEVKNEEHEDDEQESPVIKRGKARVKSSFIVDKEMGSPERKSTKVEVNKPRQSILDKYKYRPKAQPRIEDSIYSLSGGGDFKRKKLVSAAEMANSSPAEILVEQHTKNGRLSSLSSAFSYNNNSFSRVNKAFASGMVNPDPPKPKMKVSLEDDLDMLEEKIKRNRKISKGTKKSSRKVSDDELEDDVISDDMSQEEDEESYNSGLTSIDSKILEFLNTASLSDIVEISNVQPKVAKLLISKRPYTDIYAVAEDRFELEEDKKDDPTSKKRRGGQKKTVGLKIVESTEFSLKGYQAVDSLIKKCSEYGSMISEQIEKWGVTVTGEGELEMTEIEPVKEEILLSNNEENNDNENEDENDDVIIVDTKKKGLKYIKYKPELLSEEVELKNYQQVGINWLNLLYHNKLSCILADEMGLGKTCQIISFMAHLKATYNIGQPHLVIVPASTVENWMREFQKFCPDLVVQAYYGTQSERDDLRYELQEQYFDVLVTTYNLATGAAPDFKFLRNQNFNIIVYDEGHMLKNSTSERYNKLMRLKADFRLLLTGTPLQNNLRELVSLLAFMLPDLFNGKRDDLQGLFSQKVSTINSEDENFNPLLSVQAITKAKTMMTPFVLRRKKNQVLKHLPKKHHEVLRCELYPKQREIYQDYLTQGKETRLERERIKSLSAKEADLARKKSIPSSSNVMMSLRKAALHPLLFRNLYKEEHMVKMSKLIMSEPEYVEANQQYILEDMRVMSDYELNNLCEKFPKTLSKFILEDKDYLESGKVKKLLELLDSIINKKEKVLIFSLFTQVLDILEKVLTISGISFLRLDGSTTVDTRQDLIDTFYDDETIPVFLLSTKAGGFGINLVAANNVIIFDQSFNPHDDKQAEDRAHRVGQTNEVTVYKLISENTIEENMLQLAENKLQLDQSISNNEISESKIEQKVSSLFENILFDGAD